MHILLENENIHELEQLVIKDNKIQPIPFEAANRFTQSQISVFCLKHALYQFPTTELIDWLKNEIGISKTIEIGAGNGVIGRNLGIQMTDNHMQTWPHIRYIYDNLKQPPIIYGKDVEEIPALDAIDRYKPETVLACWVTHKYAPGLTEGNQYGVEEEKMFIKGVKKYIHVGNETIHESKPLIKHMITPKGTMKRYWFPWLLSRSMQRTSNVIYVFS